MVIENFPPKMTSMINKTAPHPKYQIYYLALTNQRR